MLLDWHAELCQHNAAFKKEFPPAQWTHTDEH